MGDLGIPKSDSCPFCEPSVHAPMCEFETRYRCTRELGHSGPHIACGSHQHILSIWDSKNEKWQSG